MKSITVLFDEQDYNLDEDAQAYVRANWADKTLGVIDLAKKVYKKKDLTGRSDEVKKLRLYIKKVSMEETRAKAGQKQIDFTKENREFIRDNAETMGPMDIAKIIFQNNSLVPLSKEVKLVDRYIKMLGLSQSPVSKDEPVYKVPEAQSRLIRKVNVAKPDVKLAEEKLTGAEKRALEQLKVYLGNQRFIISINAIRDQAEKDLFESEYINGIFGKDLNSEELNAYISLCYEYVLQKQIKEQLEMLNDEIKDCVSDDDKTIKISLVEMCGKKYQELDACSKRMQVLQKSLSGERSKREENQSKLNASLTAFVETWKSEDGRKRMIMIAKATKLEVNKEIEKMENEEGFIANIMGISKEEILNG